MEKPDDFAGMFRLWRNSQHIDFHLLQQRYFENEIIDFCRLGLYPVENQERLLFTRVHLQSVGIIQTFESA